jgi:hypothetical protein
MVLEGLTDATAGLRVWSTCRAAGGAAAAITARLPLLLAPALLQGALARGSGVR